MAGRIAWETGNLWPRLKAQREHGLQVGALKPIETALEHIESGGLRFMVRILANLSRKEQALKQQARQKREGKEPVNPFLPYARDLYVTDISDTHLCLLNKFNVVDHHFLIVTRAFESQQNWLTLADFAALVRCLSEVDGLAFFNGGPAAGASQPHKHLQVVPYAGDLQCFPVEDAISTAKKRGHIWQSPGLPFPHAISQRLDQPMSGTSTVLGKANAISEGHLADLSQPSDLALQYLTGYRQLLNAVGIGLSQQWQGAQTSAYNLLCTRQWMMVVPRSQEKFADISVNSLGFAGSLLVKNEQTLSQLKKIGPMNLLKRVSGSFQGMENERLDS